MSSSETDSRRPVSGSEQKSEGDRALLEVQQLAPAQARAVALSFGARRGTMATRSYRALADLAEVTRQGERFLAFASPEPNTGCHLWTGSATLGGYGQFRLWPQKVTVVAHRFAWVLANNLVVPERADVDHAVCNNRLCVNPAHLEIVSHAENLRRRDARRTHCRRGHALTADNLTSDTTHKRMCLACLRIRQDAARLAA